MRGPKFDLSRLPDLLARLDAPTPYDPDADWVATAKAWVRERAECAVAIRTLMAAHEAAIESLTAIRDRAVAYPVSVFPAMTGGDYRRAHAALQSVGLTSDRLHAAWARKILAAVIEGAKDGGCK